MDSAVTARWLAATATVPMPVMMAVMTIWGHAHDGALQAAGEAQSPGGQQATPLELIALVQADADGGLFAEQGRQKQQAHQGGGEPRGKGGAPYTPPPRPTW